MLAFHINLPGPQIEELCIEHSAVGLLIDRMGLCWSDVETLIGEDLIEWQETLFNIVSAPEGWQQELPRGTDGQPVPLQGDGEQDSLIRK